jgi:hypothetical protein
MGEKLYLQHESFADDNRDILAGVAETLVEIGEPAMCGFLPHFRTPGLK